MAPTHLEKLILELLSMQRSVFFGVLWPASVGPSTVLAVSGFLTLGELGGLGRHLWAIEATTCLSNSPSLSASSSVEAQTRSLQILWGYSAKRNWLRLFTIWHKREHQGHITWAKRHIVLGREYFHLYHCAPRDGQIVVWSNQPH